MYSIDKLIIVAGLSRSGKTTLINKLNNNEVNTLCEKLDLDPISSYQFCYAVKLKLLNQNIDKLIVHYDVLARFSNENGFDNLHELMKNSNDIKIITVCATEDILIKRSTLSVYKLLDELSKVKNITPYDQHLPLINKLKNRITIQTIYQKTESIPQLYENWFATLKQYHAYKHWLLDSQKPNQPVNCPETMADIWSFIKATSD